MRLVICQFPSEQDSSNGVGGWGGGGGGGGISEILHVQFLLFLELRKCMHVRCIYPTTWAAAC